MNFCNVPDRFSQMPETLNFFPKREKCKVFSISALGEQSYILKLLDHRAARKMSIKAFTREVQIHPIEGICRYQLVSVLP